MLPQVSSAYMIAQRKAEYLNGSKAGSHEDTLVLECHDTLNAANEGINRSRSQNSMKNQKLPQLRHRSNSFHVPARSKNRGSVLSGRRQACPRRDCVGPPCSKIVETMGLAPALTAFFFDDVLRSSHLNFNLLFFPAHSIESWIPFFRPFVFYPSQVCLNDSTYYRSTNHAADLRRDRPPYTTPDGITTARRHSNLIRFSGFAFIVL